MPLRAWTMSLPGLASLTESVCPSRTKPLREDIAAWAASADSISTNPKPRERPVFGSVINSAERSGPKGVNKSSNSGKHKRWGRFPTKSRTLKLTSKQTHRKPLLTEVITLEKRTTASSLLRTSVAPYARRLKPPPGRFPLRPPSPEKERPPPGRGSFGLASLTVKERP